MIVNLLNFLVIIFLISNLILKDKFDNIYSSTTIANILLIILFFLFFFLKKKIKNNLFVALISTYISFFFINIFVKKNIYKDTAASLIQKYKKDKINLRPSVFPALFFDNKEMLIFSSLSNQMTIYCKEDNFWSIYKTDRYGFNNNDKVYDKSNKVVLVGDSFTHGACVKEGDDIAGSLRKKGINAINMGMGGNSELSKLATLKEYGVKVKPDMVLWMYTIGDLGGFLGELKKTRLSKYFYDPNYSQNLFLKNKEKDEFINKYLAPMEKREKIDYFFGYITLYDLRKFLKFEILPKIKLPKLFKFKKKENNEEVKTGVLQSFDIEDYYENIYTEKNLKLFQQNLKIAKDTCEINSCEIKFVFLPSRKDFLQQKKKFKFKNNLFAKVKKLNIDVIDLEDIFLNVEINDYMISHYNTKGYKLASDNIYDKIFN